MECRTYINLADAQFPAAITLSVPICLFNILIIKVVTCLVVSSPCASSSPVTITIPIFLMQCVEVWLDTKPK